MRWRYFLGPVALVVLTSACSGSTAHRAIPAAGSGPGAVSLAQALSDLRSGHTAVATQELRALVKLDPGDKYAWFDLGVTASDAGNVSEADRLYQKAIAIDPTFEVALFNYGYDRWQTGNYVVATSYLRRAIGANPGDANAHLYLGVSLAKQAESNPALGNEAADELRLAVKINPALRGVLQKSILGVVAEPTPSATSTTTQGPTTP